MITTIKLAHHQHEAGITTLGWQHNTTPPFEGDPYGLHQAYLESAQTLHEIEVWSTHIQPTHLCQHIGALWLPSAPYHECSDTGYLCA